jgi:hypothetical protein
MTETICPSLRRLGMLLQAAYRQWDNRIANGKDDSALAKAERDLRRVHNLILQHRAFCRFCIFNEALQGLPTRYSKSHSNVIPIDRVLH